tara:strand:+ start:1689 stop:2267 length:579 start_codon:yes stop_codon:yes gene_type:complete
MKNRKRKSIKADGTNPKGGELIRGHMIPVTEKELQRMINDALTNPSNNLDEHEIRQLFLKRLDERKNSEFWNNSIYQVQAFRNQHANHMVHVDGLKDQCGYITIKRNDKRPINSWQDVQTIKNRLFGIEREAIQIFPAESRMVNTANQYHIIVFPEGHIIPFGFIHGRTVDTRHAVGAGHGSKGQNFTGEQL